MQELHASIRSQLAVQASQLRALAQRLTSGPEAEDCVQNTMVAALSQHDRPRKLRPWLRRVLRNEIHAHHRSGSRRQDRERVSAVPEPTLAPDDLAEQEQIATAMHRALDALEEPYRSTLRRRFLLGHPMTRIAEEEGCPPATVRWRVHEGLRRMRRMLDERFEGRQQWLGGMALLAGGPVEGAAPHGGAGADTTMTKTTITTGSSTLYTKLALAGVFVAGAAVLAGSSALATPASEVLKTNPSLAVPSPSPTPTSPRVLLGDEAHMTVPCDEGGCDAIASSEDQADVDPSGAGFIFAGGNASPGSWSEALEACQAALGPDQAWERIELEAMAVGGEEGSPAYFETLEVTTGRKIPCSDPVDEPTPVDADGVEHHPELAECLQATVDPTELFAPLLPGEARGMMMVYTDAIDESPIPGGPLPAADEMLAATEPENAPAIFDLPGLGSQADDAIAVVECIDYDCPFCNKARKTVQQLLEGHPEVAFHVLNNPLPMHKGAAIAARAAVAAAAQGKAWEMHDALFDDREARTVATVIAKAVELDLDAERFEADLLSEETGRRVATEAAVCRNGGGGGTPSFFVGGDLVVGTQGYEVLAEAVEFELSQL